MRLSTIRLAPLEAEHLFDLHQIVSDPDVGRYWETRGEPVSVHDFSELVYAQLDLQSVVLGLRTGSVVGMCALTDVQPQDGHATVSLFLDRPSWGTTRAAEVIVGFASLVFSRTPIEKLYFPAHEDVVDRAGRASRYLATEGVLKGHVLIGGRRGDMHVLSLTRQEFGVISQRGIVQRVLQSSDPLVWNADS